MYIVISIGISSPDKGYVPKAFDKMSSSNFKFKLKSKQPSSLSLIHFFALISVSLFLFFCSVYLLFLGQGEVSPGCDGDPSVTGVAAPAHDAKPVIVTHSPVVAIAELINFI